MPLARHDGPGLPPGPSRVPCEDVDDATLGVGLGVSDEQHVASGCERRSEAVAVRGVRSRDLLRRAPDAPGVGPEAVDDPRSIGITRLADVHLVSTDRERRAERIASQRVGAVACPPARAPRPTSASAAIPSATAAAPGCARSAPRAPWAWRR